MLMEVNGHFDHETLVFTCNTLFVMCKTCNVSMKSPYFSLTTLMQIKTLGRQLFFYKKIMLKMTQKQMFVVPR